MIARRNIISVSIWALLGGLTLSAQPVPLRDGSSPFSGRAGSGSVLTPDGRMIITGGDAGEGALGDSVFFGASGVFVRTPPMLQPRSQHASALLPGGRVLVAGGTSSSAALASAEIFDPKTGKWTPAGSMTAARTGATASVMADGRVLIAGGMVGGQPAASIEIYDPGTNEFSLAPFAFNTARSGHAAAALKDGRILFAGGSDGVEPLASMEIYDPASGQISPAGKMPTARDGLTATTLLNGRVFIAGGSDGVSELATTEIFDPSNGSFAAGDSMSVARRGHVAVLLPNNNTVILFGGRSSGETIFAPERYVPWWNKFQPFKSASSKSPVAMNATRALTPKDASMSSPTIATDQQDYSPGQTVTITGAGWAPGETVTMDLSVDPQTHADVTLTSVADASGNFTNTDYVVQDSDLGVTFTLTATGSTGDTAQTITFTDANFTLTLTINGTGSGTVYFSTPSEASCTASCNKSYSSGTQVTLTATANANSTFAGWGGTGGCTGTGSCTVTMSAARAVTATFNGPTLTLTKSGSGQGTVTSSPSPGLSCGTSCSTTSITYAYGTSVTLTESVSGYGFGGWSGVTCNGGVNTNATCTFTLNGNTTVNADFEPLQTLTVSNNTSDGTVTSSPAGISCGATCSAQFASNTSVTLTAAANTGFAVSSWTGCTSSNGNQCSVTMTSAVNVTVNYSTGYKLTVNNTGSEGTISSVPPGINNCATTPCTGQFPASSSVTVTATANAGYQFSSWTGCASTNGNQCTVTLNGNTTVTASYVRLYTLTVTETGSVSGATVTSSPAGINCAANTGTCTYNWPSGTLVTLTATPGSGNAFNVWSGISACGNQQYTPFNNPQCTGIQIGANGLNTSITADFEPAVSFTVNIVGSGNVYQTGNTYNTPGSLQCGPAFSPQHCTINVASGSYVTLQAGIPGVAGYGFGSWSGACTGTSNACMTGTITSATTVTATFTAEYGLAVSIAGTGASGGNVSSTGGGTGTINIACPGTCSSTFTSPNVTLTATPTGSALFDHWADVNGNNPCAGSQTAASCALTLTGTGSNVTNITAYFASNTGTVYAQGSGSGSISVLGNYYAPDPCTYNGSGYTLCMSGTLYNPTNVTLTAAPAAGSVFTGWSGACTGSSLTCQYQLNHAQSVTATFSLNTFTLTVNAAGDGRGSVNSSPTGINCNYTGSNGSPCATASFNAGTPVMLTATASAGSVFTGWSGAGCSGVGTCTVTMNSAATVTANFDAAPTVTDYRVLFGSQAFSMLTSSRNRLPWTISGIQVVFSKAVNCSAGALTGVSVGSCGGSGTNTLTFAITPLTLGLYSTSVSVADLAGVSMAAPFSQAVKVLYGDFNDDGAVNSADVTGVNNARAGAYNIFADLNGDGVVNTTDVTIARSLIGASLP